ncbi:glycosyltransferase family 4 protein [Bordetella bronchiseptica]|uniref:glycosyltransferase family 4 protein n=1 Tax=Bordetella bronchiseptica TaxID=518 RepID=UPI00081CCCB4|nr:glycosyltransferase family 4 protein [Bordetella bronchiseptica]AOB24892.1 glycosyltransferase WbuB [Bordetella bronchiseptica]
MHILLLNHYAGSPDHGMEYRPYYLAREWGRQGHRVQIIASSESHLRLRNPTVNTPTAVETINGIEYCWIRTSPYEGNGVRRLINMAQFTARVYGMATALAASRPDIVIASSTYPYDIVAARRIARKAKARLVYEIHDLWPLTPQLLGNFPSWHPMIASMQWAENYAYRHADKVISILPGTESHARAHGMAPGKFAHVPNGFDPTNQPSILPTAVCERIEAFSQAFRATCIYTGGHAVSNALDPLLAAAGKPACAGIGIILVGKGVEKARLQAYADQHALHNVLFVDPVEKSAIPSILKLADFAYLGWQDSPLYAHGMSPNKLFDYMMAGLPVVHSTSSPFDLVRDAHCGISVPAEDSDAIAQALAQMAQLSPGQRHALGTAGQAYVYAHHPYPRLAEQFLQALDT